MTQRPLTRCTELHSFALHRNTTLTRRHASLNRPLTLGRYST